MGRTYPNGRCITCGRGLGPGAYGMRKCRLCLADTKRRAAMRRKAKAAKKREVE